MSQAKALIVGTAWVALGQGLGFFLRFFSSWILAKLLAPEDYGRLGWAMAFVTLFELLSDLGLVPTLIRHSEGMTPRFLQVAWSVNLARGALLALICLGCAAITAFVYGNPVHGFILALLGTRPLIIALRSPAIVRRRAKLDFRAVFLEEFLSTVAGIGTSVIWALYDPDARAIVAGTLVGALTNVIISYAIEPMVPRWTWDPTIVAELGQSSKKIFLNTMVMAFWMNLDRLLGPYWVVDTQLGAYVLAWNLASAVEGLLTKALDVHYSQMARKMAQTGHAQDLDELHERAGRWKRLYVFPGIVVIAALAPTLIWVLYDHRYEDARMILPLLILRLIPRLHGQFHFQRLLAQGHLAPATWAYFLAAIVQVAVMGPLCRWSEAAGAGGGKGLALSVMISTVTWTLAQDILAGRYSGKARWEWVHFLAWAGGGAAVASFF